VVQRQEEGDLVDETLHIDNYRSFIQKVIAKAECQLQELICGDKPLSSLFTMDSESESDFDSDPGPDLECPSDSDEPSGSESLVRAGSTVPKKKGHNSIRARIQALTKFKDRVLHKKITAQTGISRSGCYKLRSKAISCR
jgi:hypothetical protein